MAKNRKNQAAAIRFGPALKASFLCLVIGGSAVGYVWQKNEIYRLGQQIRQRETKLLQLQADNKRLGDQISILHSPVMLDQRAKELQLGLAPATPLQVVRLTETPAAPEKNSPRQFAQRLVNFLTP
ncbi:MAG TPA: septum formation initiator family protein [Verrucomicrobiae bacterium]|jgi:cell division protein FtsB